MGLSHLTEGYLIELDRGLRPLGHRRRQRLVQEARDHLSDAAGEVGEPEALRRFGAADAVAAAHLRGAALAAPGRAIAAFAAAGIGYGVIEAVCSPALFGVFPPGPWPNDVPPPYLAWKVDLAGALVGIAFLIGLAAIVVAWRARHRPLCERARAAQLAVGGAAVFAASWPFEMVFFVQRGNNVAGSPPAAVTGLVGAALLATMLGAIWATTRSWRVVRAAGTAAVR